MTVAGGPARFPWADAMALGLGRLGLAPREFWNMTPKELAAAAAALAAPAAEPPRRDDLARLMARYPDHD